MNDERIYRELKALKKYPEWQTFVERVKTVALTHEDSSVRYSRKGNMLDSQRQAWIAEGLVEAIEEPENVVRSYEFSVKGMYERVCHLCGQVIGNVKL